MKTLVLMLAFCAGLLASPEARAARYVKAPVTLSATVTTNLDPVEGSTYVRVKTTAARFSNANLIADYRRRGLISSTTGWAIYCYFDSAMDEDIPPLKFELRHNSGKVVSLAKEIKASLMGSTGEGRIDVNSAAKLSGKLTLTGFYRVIVNFQNYTATMYGEMILPLKVSGDENAQYVTPSGVSGSLLGYVDEDTRVKMSVSAGEFTKR